MMFFAVIAPLVTAAIAVPLARSLDRSFGWWTALVPALVCAGLLQGLLALGEGAPARVEALPWAPALDLALHFRLDGLSGAFGLLIAGIGALICVYAGGYFRGDPRRGRFQAWLLFFMASMLGVVFADNVLVLFVFWELTSVASFLLIGFEHRKESARDAAWQALLVTGAGGLALLAGLVLLGEAAGSYRLGEIIATPGLASHPHYTAIVVLVVVGAATKSAQFPFHFWLPNAMAAPTPASAYLHSSTMVKAGIYLLARLNPALGEGALWFWLLVGIGGATMLAGAWLSLQQDKLKPMLAYSTITALGTLVLCIGLGTPVAIQAFTVFLFVHAFYKAALFMTAGTLTHETGEARVEQLGGLGRAMPISALSALVAALSMAGLPPLLGFVGKESIYEAVLQAPVAMQVLVAGAVLANVTNVYVAVMVGVLPFWRRRGSHDPVSHEALPSLWLGTAVLAALGLLAGLFPAMLGRQILAPGGASILGEGMAIKLKLWHGVNEALILSIVTLVLGAAVVLLRRPWRTVTAPLARLDRVGPEAAYRGTVSGMLWFANAQTRFLQHGYLRYYLLVVLVCVIVAVAGALQPALGGIGFTPLSLRVHELITVALIAMAALALTRMRSRFGALACLGVVGYGVALLYVFYGAPDLAKTQIIVESLTVVFFALLAAAMPGFKVLTTPYERRRDAVIAAAAGCLMGVLVYGALASDQTQPVASFYRENSVPLAHGRNVVNVILVDFRSLDTLGEITVLAVAAFGSVALLRLRSWRKGAR